MKSIKNTFNNKTILITGGTGSFGQSFIEFLLKKTKAKKIIIFSRDEMKQYFMSQKLASNKLRFFIGDVRDQSRLFLAMKEVDIVVHAAALKIVETAEYNPMEVVNTNIMGTQNVCLASIAAGVSKVVLISTDKAVNPINLYGSTKLSAEKLIIAANNLSSNITKFSVVRYGNVYGSRGSIIDLYKNLTKKNLKYLPVTDVFMTRFLLTLNQGVEFVFNSVNLMIGGEIFIPKIPSVKILDIVKAFGNYEPKIIGIRPGEKVNEILISHEEMQSTIEYNNFFIIEPNIKINLKNINYKKFYQSKYNLKNKKLTYKYYDSLNNKKWLKVNDIKKLIN